MGLFGGGKKVKEVPKVEEVVAVEPPPIHNFDKITEHHEGRILCDILATSGWSKLASQAALRVFRIPAFPKDGTAALCHAAELESLLDERAKAKEVHVRADIVENSLNAICRINSANLSGLRAMLERVSTARCNRLHSFFNTLLHVHEEPEAGLSVCTSLGGSMHMHETYVPAVPMGSNNIRLRMTARVKRPSFESACDVFSLHVAEMAFRMHGDTTKYQIIGFSIKPGGVIPQAKRPTDQIVDADDPSPKKGGDPTKKGDPAKKGDGTASSTPAASSNSKSGGGGGGCAPCCGGSSSNKSGPQAAASDNPNVIPEDPKVQAEADSFARQMCPGDTASRGGAAGGAGGVAGSLGSHQVMQLPFIRKNRKVFLNDMKTSFVSKSVPELHFLAHIPNEDGNIWENPCTVFCVMELHLFWTIVDDKVEEEDTSPSKKKKKDKDKDKDKPTEWRAQCFPRWSSLVEGVWYDTEFAERLQFGTKIHGEAQLKPKDKPKPPVGMGMRIAEVHCELGLDFFEEGKKFVKDHFQRYEFVDAMVRFLEVMPMFDKNLSSDIHFFLGDPLLSRLHCTVKRLRFLRRVQKDCPSVLRGCWHAAIQAVFALCNEDLTPSFYFLRPYILRSVRAIEVVDGELERKHLTVAHGIAKLLRVMEIRLALQRLRVCSPDLIECLAICCGLESARAFEIIYFPPIAYPPMPSIGPPAPAVEAPPPKKSPKKKKKKKGESDTPEKEPEPEQPKPYFPHLCTNKDRIPANLHPAIDTFELCIWSGLNMSLRRALAAIAFERPLPEEKLFPQLFLRHMHVENLLQTVLGDGGALATSSNRPPKSVWARPGVWCIDYTERLPKHRNSKLYHNNLCGHADELYDFPLACLLTAVIPRINGFQPDPYRASVLSQTYTSLSGSSLLYALSNCMQLPSQVQVDILLDVESHLDHEDWLDYTAAQYEDYFDRQDWAFLASPTTMNVSDGINKDVGVYMDLFVKVNYEEIPHLRRGNEYEFGNVEFSSDRIDGLLMRPTWIRVLLFITTDLRSLPRPFIALDDDHPAFKRANASTILIPNKKLSTTDLPDVANLSPLRLPSMCPAIMRDRPGTAGSSSTQASAFYLDEIPMLGGSDPHDVLIVKCQRYLAGKTKLLTKATSLQQRLDLFVQRVAGGTDDLACLYAKSWIFRAKLCLQHMEVCLILMSARTVKVNGRELWETWRKLAECLNRDLIPSAAPTSSMMFLPELQIPFMQLVNQVLLQAGQPPETRGEREQFIQLTESLMNTGNAIITEATAVLAFQRASVSAHDALRGMSLNATTQEWRIHRDVGI